MFELNSSMIFVRMSSYRSKPKTHICNGDRDGLDQLSEAPSNQVKDFTEEQEGDKNAVLVVSENENHVAKQDVSRIHIISDKISEDDKYYAIEISKDVENEEDWSEAVDEELRIVENVPYSTDIVW